METIPSFSEFALMAERGNLIPIYREFLSDTETPVSAYLKIRNESFSYLLESAEGGERWGRYSFIGYRPYLIFQSGNHKMEIQEGANKEIMRDVQDPLSILRRYSLKYKPVLSGDLPPFQGGLVGYINYDLIRKWECLPGVLPENPQMPESIFVFSKCLIIFDHLTHQIKVVGFAFLQGRDRLREVYDRACQEIDETIAKLKHPLSSVSAGAPLVVSALESNFKKEDFEAIVRKAREYIIAGDVIQVVLSQRFTGNVSGDLFTLYRNLRSINPSPYMFYLNYGDTKLIGSSPEILVRLINRKIELRPIAGTRPRGETQEKDLSFEKELLNDAKELAEHIMLVDLGRNDAGKVASAGSVTAPRLMEVERYSHVMHIVSRVEGLLHPEMNAFDVFRASFPAGTVTGAPKIRAMEIISELEPCQRGAYAGAVGYFSFNGNMDFCITIRTIAIIKGKISIQAGAGIVYDSSPEAEYDETLKKALAMLKAIERANGK